MGRRGAGSKPPPCNPVPRFCVITSVSSFLPACVTGFRMNFARLEKRLKTKLRVRFPMGLEKHVCNGNEFAAYGLERQLNIRDRRGRGNRWVRELPSHSLPRDMS